MSHKYPLKRINQLQGGIFLYITLMLLLPNTSFSADFADEMDTFDEGLWHLADGWNIGYWIDNGWRADHADIDNSRLIITLDDQPCSSDIGLCSGKELASGEVRTNEFYGYGSMSATMKVARGSGIITAFFKYTGPSDGNPQDEIDFEFLGSNTTQVMLNYFKNGVGGNETYIDLGFDAAEGFHTYTINHLPEKVEWFIDGRLVHTISGEEVPPHAGRIMLSLWAVADGTDLEGWAGERDNSILPLQAEYDSVTFTAWDGASDDEPSDDESSGPHFQITSKHSDLLLSVLHGGTDEGNQLVQWPVDSWLAGGQHQFFSFEPSGEDYAIRPKHSNLCIDASGNYGNDIVQRGCAGNNSQKWYFTSASNGYNIVSRSTGHCATLYEDRLTLGTWLMTLPCEGKSSQEFSLGGYSPTLSDGTPSTPPTQPPPTSSNTYSLVSILSNQLLTVAHGKLEDGTQLAQWPVESWRVNGAHQRMAFETDGTDYTIRPEHSGLCLDSRGNYGNDIVQRSCDDSASQQWSLSRTTSGFKLISQASGLCATVYNDWLELGAWIVGENCADRTAQEFRIDGFPSDDIDTPTPPSTSNVHNIVAAHSNLYLSLAHANAASGAQLVQWPAEPNRGNGFHQAFTFEPSGNDYLIRAKHSGMCLDTFGNYGIDVVQRICDDQQTQRWYFTPTTGGYKIVSRASNQCATVYDNSTTLGSWIFAQPCDSLSAQTFIIDGFEP